MAFEADAGLLDARDLQVGVDRREADERAAEDRWPEPEAVDRRGRRVSRQELAHGRHEVANARSTEMPDPLGARAAVALVQRAEILIRFLHEERRAGGGAPSSNMLGLEHHDVHTRLSEDVGDPGAGHASADDGNIRRCRATQRRISPPLRR